MGKIYTVADLTDCIIKEYHLETNTDSDRRKYYYQVRRVMVDLNLLEQGEKRMNPKTHRMAMFYTEEHKQQILSCKKMFNYVRNNSELSTLSKSPRYDEMQIIINRRREKHIQYLSQLTTGDETSAPYITDKEFEDCKTRMMIEALFDKWFTRIDDDLLRLDLELAYIYKDESNITREVTEAEIRLAHPEGFYYHKRKRGNSTSRKVNGKKNGPPQMALR